MAASDGSDSEQNIDAMIEEMIGTQNATTSAANILNGVRLELVRLGWNDIQAQRAAIAVLQAASGR